MGTETLSAKKGHATGMHRMACADTGTKCSVVFEGRNDDRIVLKAVEHMAHDHGAALSVDLAARVRALIKPA